MLTKRTIGDQLMTCPNVSKVFERMVAFTLHRAKAERVRKPARARVQLRDIEE